MDSGQQKKQIDNKQSCENGAALCSTNNAQNNE
jgi:hypothetical protein